jgi:beta-lactam-binding protein with PASTA domain
MSDYRTTETVAPKRRGAGSTIAIILVVIALIVGVLFATGFWSADVKKDGALPEVSVKGGELPKVDMDSKEVVVGTKKTEVEVPKVKTETETVDVPTVGVKQ